MKNGPHGTPPLEPQPRANDRFAVAGEATLRREGGNNYRVQVFDISSTGCKVEIVERPVVDERVWIRFEGLESLHATVMWVAPPLAGLQFERPIHPAVFAALMTTLSRAVRRLS
jgi:hypothetical protein